MSLSEPFEIVAPVAERDLDDLDRALAALSRDIGDIHRADRDSLRRACLGPCPACCGLLLRQAGEAVAAALVSPVFSTTQAGAGAYVSDLWVAEGYRGRGLGATWLAEVARFAARRWAARFLKLTVYADNRAAGRFYERLGFEMLPRDRSCQLGAEGFRRLVGDDA